MKKTIGYILYYAFALLFMGLPALALAKSDLKLSELPLYEEGWIVLGFLLAAAFVFFALPKLKKPLPDNAPLYISVMLSIAFRWACYSVIGSGLVMKYDYLTVLESARGAYAAKEAIFTHWAFYPRILSVWFKIFGDSFRSAVAFNIAVGALSVALVYAIAFRLWKNQRLAFAASCALGLWPSLGVYHSVTSNEHLAMFGMLLASYLAVCACKSEGRKRWILAALTGFACGAADMFKQFSPVFIIAAAITALVFWLLKKGGAKQLLAIALSLLLVFVCANAVKALSLAYLDNYLGHRVCRNAANHFLWIGLNSRSDGMWSKETGMLVYELADKYDNDYEKVMAEIGETLKADLKAHPERIYPTIQHKMEIDWAADTGVSAWVEALHAESFVFKDRLYMWSGAYYAAAMLLVAVGGITAMLKRCEGALYMRLIVFGYALLLILSEAQGRYQLVLFPFFALLAARGAWDFTELVKSVFEGKKNEG